MSPLTHLWQVWPGRHWPLSPAEETEFVDELAHRAGRKSITAWDRGDVTSLMNALRCGLTVDELLAFGVGLRPERLLAAYRVVEARRAESGAAWAAVRKRPDIGTLTARGVEAARLLPTPVYRITEAVQSLGQEPLDVVMADIRERVADMERQVRAAERRLGRIGTRGDPDQAIEFGATLYHPYQQGLWGHPYYLATRVGELTPPRVADLLSAEHELDD